MKRLNFIFTSIIFSKHVEIKEKYLAVFDVTSRKTVSGLIKRDTLNLTVANVPSVI